CGVLLDTLAERHGYAGARSVGGLGGPGEAPHLLQAYQLRDALAVIAGVAKRELGRLGALEVEMQVVLPGEADAAVQLDAGARDLPEGVGSIGLGHRGSQRRLGDV